MPRSQRRGLELRQQAACAQPGIKLPGRAGCDGAAQRFDGFQTLLEYAAGVDVVKHFAGCNADQPGLKLIRGRLRQMNFALCHAEPGQPAGAALAGVGTLVYSQQDGFGLVTQ